MGPPLLSRTATQGILGLCCLTLLASGLSCNGDTAAEASAGPSSPAPTPAEQSNASPSFSDSDRCFAYVDLWVIQIGTGARSPYDVYYELGQMDPMTDFILAMWREDLRNRASYGISEGSRRTQAAITEGCDGRYLGPFRRDVDSGKIIPPG